MATRLPSASSLLSVRVLQKMLLVMRNVVVGYLVASSIFISASPPYRRSHDHPPDDDASQSDGPSHPSFNYCQTPEDVAAVVCQEKPLSRTATVLYATTVLYGKVLNVYPDKRTKGFNNFNIYTAEMQIYCILKGEINQAVINISEAGYIPGRCYETKLEMNKSYIIIAHRIGSHMCVVDNEIPDDAGSMKEVTSACHLEPRYPEGVKESEAPVKCPLVSRPPDCVDKSHFTSTTTVKASPYDEEYYYGFSDEYYEEVQRTESSPSSAHHIQRTVGHLTCYLVVQSVLWFLCGQLCSQP